MTAPADILLITTGGTIDAEAYPDPDHPPEFIRPLRESAVPRAVQRICENWQPPTAAPRVRFKDWGITDSKEFSEQEMLKVAEFIKASPEKHIIITHGTDWMAPNARTLRNQLRSIDTEGKSVAFTGAMIPLANGEKSDGPANLEFTLRHIAEWPPGVYISMHGKRLYAQLAEKDPDAKTFFMPL